MKTKGFYIGLFCMIMALISCDKDEISIKPSSTISRETRSVSSFNRIDISDTFEAFVSIGNEPEGIVIEANDNLFKHIVVENRGDRLIVKLKDRTNIKGNPTLKAYITASTLEAVQASGASSVYLQDRLENQFFSLDLSGASDFNGFINTLEMEADLSGASDAQLSGKVGNMDAFLSGASNLKDFSLSVKELQVDMTGASNCNLSVSEKIDVRASGASSLYYIGNAQIVNQSLSGASQIIRTSY